MLMFHVPQDDELLVALGEVTIRHEHLNHILKMTIKSLAEISPAEAFDATRYEGTGKLRRRIKKLARNKLGEGPPLLKLQALITRAERLTNQRNIFIHGLWAQELDGEAGLMAVPGELLPLPSVNDLRTLSNDIKILTEELNSERIEGFLKIALEEKDTK